MNETTWEELLQSRDRFDDGSRLVVWDAETNNEYFCELVWITDGKSDVERPVLAINLDKILLDSEE